MSDSFQILRAKLRKAVGQIPMLPRGLALVWHVARPWTIAWFVLLMIQGLFPAVIVYLTKLIIDGIVAGTRSAGRWPAMRPVLLLVVLLAGTMLLMEVARSASSWIRTVQAELLKDHISNLIHSKSIAADLAFYEFPDYYDHLHRARTEAGYRPIALLENLGSLFQNSITLLAMGAILITLGPWLALALVISTLPALFVVVYYALHEYEWRQRTTADDRRTWYFDWVMTTVEAAAELRLFGLGKHFQSAYQTLRKKLREERLRLARRQSIAELAASLIALLVTAVALAWMVWKAMQGLVTLGDLALIYVAFNQGQRLMRLLLESVGQLYANSLFLGNLFEFLALEPMIEEAPPEKAKTPVEVKERIVFRNITFRYAQNERRALENFDLTIEAGQIAAIVGPNGAGKSTLVKLLCRFYDPETGTVEIDGQDLKDISTTHLRRLLTVLFQRPVNYNATVKENIAYGNLESEPDDREIEAAVEAAGARDIVSKLPAGYRSLLGRWFAGGTELSVGEWQRIALARAFLRRAPVIILDEPTSALDPWAETDWLQRFRKLAQGRTTILITHRFTTAMHADVIHVMDEGRIVESGSHENLLRQNGRYARSWMQQMRAAELAVTQNV